MHPCVSGRRPRRLGNTLWQNKAAGSAAEQAAEPRSSFCSPLRLPERGSVLPAPGTGDGSKHGPGTNASSPNSPAARSTKGKTLAASTAVTYLLHACCRSGDSTTLRYSKPDAPNSFSSGCRPRASSNWMNLKLCPASHPSFECLACSSAWASPSSRLDTTGRRSKGRLPRHSKTCLAKLSRSAGRSVTRAG